MQIFQKLEVNCFDPFQIETPAAQQCSGVWAVRSTKENKYPEPQFIFNFLQKVKENVPLNLPFRCSDWKILDPFGGHSC